VGTVKRVRSGRFAPRTDAAKKQINGILVREMKKEAFDNGRHQKRWAEKTKED
jgi:hypothetical protein